MRMMRMTRFLLHPGPALVLIKETNDNKAPRRSTRGTTKASTCRASNKKRRKKLKKN